MPWSLTPQTREVDQILGEILELLQAIPGVRLRRGRGGPALVVPECARAAVDAVLDACDRGWSWTHRPARLPDLLDPDDFVAQFQPGILDQLADYQQDAVITFEQRPDAFLVHPGGSAPPAAVRGHFPPGHSTPAGFVGTTMNKRPGRPPLDTTKRLVLARQRVAVLLKAPRAERDPYKLELARAALRRAQKAHADATGQTLEEVRRAHPAIPRSVVLVGPAQPTRKPHRGGKSGRAPKLEGAALAERKRLLHLAIQRYHKKQGAPVKGTSWADLARALGINSQLIRALRSSPTLDKALRDYLKLEPRVCPAGDDEAPGGDDDELAGDRSSRSASTAPPCANRRGT